MKFGLVLLFILSLHLSCVSDEAVYVCTPCDLPCDTLEFTVPGICPHCQMDLIKQIELIQTTDLVVNEIAIANGAGQFLVEGGFDTTRTITVHYYKPTTLSPESPVVFVVPGAGRNGDEYRDAWIEKAEAYNVLVLAPAYSETHYPEFWNYNLAGMVTDVTLNEDRTDVESYTISKRPEEWIFNDFDRIFDLVQEDLSLLTDTYDMFGHSAGGQLLHRLAIFKPESKANRILAANSGWYTLPTNSEDFPYGLKGSKTSAREVDFSSNLILFLGELDDESETRGELRRSPEADRQGVHRLARGKFFYDQSKAIASEVQSDFNWKLEVVPNVGHDSRAMSTAAADYLYGEE